MAEPRAPQGFRSADTLNWACAVPDGGRYTVDRSMVSNDMAKHSRTAAGLILLLRKALEQGSWSERVFADGLLCVVVGLHDDLCRQG